MLSDGFFTEGEHTVIWNGTNQNGDPVAAGVYLCRLKSQTEGATLKLNYMK
jgi:flagellar hook assembly protein FlgD